MEDRVLVSDKTQIELLGEMMDAGVACWNTSIDINFSPNERLDLRFHLDAVLSIIHSEMLAHIAPEYRNKRDI